MDENEDPIQNSVLTLPAESHDVIVPSVSDTYLQVLHSKTNSTRNLQRELRWCIALREYWKRQSRKRMPK